MYLKRVFDPDEHSAFLEAKQAVLDADPPDGLDPDYEEAWRRQQLAALPKPKQTGVRLLSTTPFDHITPKWLEMGLEVGYFSVAKGHITLHAENAEVVYRILRKPGLYSCFDDRPFGSAKEAQKYIATHHAGEESPDLNNPSGYRQDNFYRTVLVDDAIAAMDDATLYAHDRAVRDAFNDNLRANRRKRAAAHQGGTVYNG